MGDAVNLAARLMACACPGQGRSQTPAVLNGSRTLFETTALEPFTVKGKRRPGRGVRGRPRSRCPCGGRWRDTASWWDATAS